VYTVACADVVQALFLLCLPRLSWALHVSAQDFTSSHFDFEEDSLKKSPYSSISMLAIEIALHWEVRLVSVAFCEHHKDNFF